MIIEFEDVQRRPKKGDRLLLSPCGATEIIYTLQGDNWSGEEWIVKRVIDGRELIRIAEEQVEKAAAGEPPCQPYEWMEPEAAASAQQ